MIYIPYIYIYIYEFKRALVATRLWTLVQIRDAEFGKRALVSTSQLNASLLFFRRFA